jgi:hypothetical protein
VHLRLGVLEDDAPGRIDEEQLTGSEPPATDGLRSRQRDRAGLRCDRHEPVLRHRERGRPQPVPVEKRSNPPAVGEDDRGGTIPRGQEPGDPPGERRRRWMRLAADRVGLGDEG